MMKPSPQDNLTDVKTTTDEQKKFPPQIHHDAGVTTTAEEGNPSAINEHDVLCGRGGLTNSHIGNKHYRHIVADHQEEYLKARKRDKILIAQRIVEIVKENGGRFLKRAGERNWVPVSDKKAQEKTSQALREGLDVRNRKLRPSKQIRRDDDSSEYSGEQVKRKGPVVALGKVVTNSIKTNETDHTMPSLAEERAVPSLVPYQRQISRSEVMDECEV